MQKIETTHHGADGVDRPATIYRRHAHDVVVIAGLLFVRTGAGPLSCFISDWRPPHYDIQRHFSLDIPQTRTLGY